jgi:alpha-methylacyl-CoA racemase
MRAREAFVEIDGVRQPAPAPRFSRTPPALPRPPSHPAQDTDQALSAWGIDPQRIAELRARGAIG